MNMRFVAIVSFILAGMSVSVFGNTEPGFSLASVSPMQRVFRDQPLEGPIGKPLQLEAAANGWASGQLLVIVGKKQLRNVHIQVSSLRSWESGCPPQATAGPSIPGDRFMLSRVHYVEIKVPSPGRISRPGWYPDPLEPLKPDSRFDIDAGMVQPFWLAIKVPPETEPGNYIGSVTVQTDGEGDARLSREIDITLRVFNFRLPKTRILHIGTMFQLISWQKFYNWMSREEQIKAWEDGAFLLARYGITPTTIPAAEFGSKPDLAYYESFYRKILDLGAPHLDIMQAWESWPVIVRNGWEELAYSYESGEWSIHESAKQAARLRENLSKAPGVKIFVAGVRPDPDLIGLVKVWVYLTHTPLDSLRDRVSLGEQAWWYVCCGPTAPYANALLDVPQIAPRILGWQVFQYGLTGFYYWRASMLGENVKGETSEEKWPNKPWKTATTPFLRASHNDGQLIYPGPGGKAWSSIRLENMRDGADDYDYLSILKDYTVRLRKAGLDPGLIRRAENALLVDPQLSVGVTEYTKDPAVVERERRRVCALIEEARVVLRQYSSKTDWQEAWRTQRQ